MLFYKVSDLMVVYKTKPKIDLKDHIQHFNCAE